MSAMSTLSIALSDETRHFVETETRRHGFATPADFVGNLLRTAQRCSDTESTEDKLLAGLASGRGPAFDSGWADRMKERVLQSETRE